MRVSKHLFYRLTFHTEQSHKPINVKAIKRKKPIRKASRPELRSTPNGLNDMYPFDGSGLEYVTMIINRFQ